jgi:hypothetical protein
LFPVDLAVSEAGFVDELSELGNGPHSPIIGKAIFPGALAPLLEVNSELGVVRDRIESLLLPDVGQVPISRPLFGRFFAGGASEGIHDQKSVLR